MQIPSGAIEVILFSRKLFGDNRGLRFLCGGSGCRTFYLWRRLLCLITKNFIFHFSMTYPMLSKSFKRFSKTRRKDTSPLAKMKLRKHKSVYLLHLTPSRKRAIRESPLHFTQWTQKKPSYVVKEGGTRFRVTGKRDGTNHLCLLSYYPLKHTKNGYFFIKYFFIYGLSFLSHKKNLS